MKKEFNKKLKGTPPLNPSSMGEWIEQFPSVEGCRFTAGRVPFVFLMVILRR